MKITCVGGGPAGLYFSVLMKLRDASHDITVHERNPEGSTYGWGVTYWAGLLDSLRGADEVSAREILRQSAPWSDGVAHVHGRTTTHRGDTGFGIGRRQLLGILAERARSLGVRVEFGREVGADTLGAADLVVAADGAGSTLRTRHAQHFGTDVVPGRNTYVWLGTSKVFDAFTFAFEETEHGWIWCYGYKFSEERSTFVVECSPLTWAGLGLDRLGESGTLELLERLFAKPLDGHPLIGRAQPDRPAQWQRFRTVTNRTWHRGNTVLLGDAAHTTHYSIGAGTTLALEDALALAEALDGTAGRAAELPAAFARYERARKSALLPAQSAARYSAQWYENLSRYVQLPAEQMFALLGQRHSPLLPHVPPRLYYRVDRAIERSGTLRHLKRHLGPHLARVLQGARARR
ncbi:FAD-binding monooxygenase [Streptomyces albus subsp. chlorinus]|uniref:FAD-dependent monooxygenase n=1 Tax=Streptomyces albus TaxID=1888 RepID=UPI00156F1D65|nr:FAD-dependent monooxygenase [Streptomyces albus]NSC23005.1 FAD-binding monooxygenase [Streptomyces albus subsp. chlorinus]